MPDWLARLLHRKEPSQLDRIETALTRLNWRFDKTDADLAAAVDKVTGAFETVGDAIDRSLTLTTLNQETLERMEERMSTQEQERDPPGTK